MACELEDGQFRTRYVQPTNDRHINSACHITADHSPRLDQTRLGANYLHQQKIRFHNVKSKGEVNDSAAWRYTEVISVRR
jgi:hypothetical protein